MTHLAYRIRRCRGNRDYWTLVRTRDDGTEIESNPYPRTYRTIERLIADALPADICRAEIDLT